MTYFPLHQTTCFFIPLVAPCKPLLDLVNKKMLFYNIQAKADDVKEFDIDILKLQSELRMLQQYVNDFASFVKGY